MQSSLPAPIRRYIRIYRTLGRRCRPRSRHGFSARGSRSGSGGNQSPRIWSAAYVVARIRPRVPGSVSRRRSRSRIASLAARGICFAISRSTSRLRLGLRSNRSSISTLASSIEARQPWRGAPGPRMLKFQQVVCGPTDLAAERGLLGNPQPFDLLGKIFPVEHPIGAAAGLGTQRGGLLLRPCDEILVVELRLTHMLGLPLGTCRQLAAHRAESPRFTRRHAGTCRLQSYILPFPRRASDPARSAARYRHWVK